MNKEEMIEAIRKEQSKWVDKQYAGKDKNKRQEKGQFFTPAELCYKLLEPFIEGKKHNVNNSGMVDPMAGSGNLLAAAIVTGVRKPEEIFANELDPEIYKVLKERLTSLGVPEKNIYNEDALDENLYNKIKKQTDFIDVIANPDFKLGNKAISEATKHLGPTGRIDKDAYRAINSKHHKPLFNIKYDYHAGPFDGQVIDDIIDDFDEETANKYSELLDNGDEISAVEYLRQKDPESPIVKDLIGQIKNPDSAAAGSDFPEEWEPYEADSNEGKSFDEIWNPHGKFAQVNPRLKDLSIDDIRNLENIDRFISKGRNDGRVALGNIPKDRAIEHIDKVSAPYMDKLPEDVKDEIFGKYRKWVDSDIDNWFDFLDNEIESRPEEFVNSSSPEIAKEAQQIVNNNDKRDDEVNNTNVEKALRKTIPGSEPDPLGVNISNEERANWNGGEDRAVDDATLSEMDNALASRTRSVKPGTEMLESAKPKGLLGAGMLYSRDNKIPKPSEERPLDANSLEQITESNPEAVQEALPDTPIAEEARQITDDSDTRNDEVNNEVVEDTIEIGGDKVRVYKPGESSSNLVSGYRYDEDGNLVNEYGRELKDFEPIDTEGGVLSHKDEDFLGPDEYIDENGNVQVDPNWKPENADEDFLGPDEYIDENGNVQVDPNWKPEGPEIQTKITDVNDMGLLRAKPKGLLGAGMLYSRDNKIPKPSEERPLDANSLKQITESNPEAVQEALPEIQTKITDVNYMGPLRAKPISVGGSSVPSVPQAPLASAETHTGGNSIGTKGILPKGSLGYSAPYMGSASTPKQSTYDSSRVGTIGKAAINTDASVVTGKQSESSGFVTNNGGNLDSGATNFRSSLAHIQPAKLPSEVEEHTSPAVNGLLGAGSGDIREALISRINMLLDKIDKETLKKLGFSSSDHNYKGTPLKKLDGATLRELVDMLESAIE